jgi:hypothetical protein
MDHPVQLSTLDLIGKRRAISKADGELVFTAIHPLLKAGTPVNLSFSGIRIVIAEFATAAIGKLYRDISTCEIEALLKVSDLSFAFLPVLEYSKRCSLEYYASSECIDRKIDDVSSNH